MGITRFIYLLFFIAIAFLFYKTDTKEVYSTKVEKPLVTFKDSVMYDITTKGVNQVIQSQYAYIFKRSEELKNATILIKSKKDLNSVNTISADQITKVNDNLYLNNNIVLETEDQVTLKTEELEYNIKTLKARNNSAFTITKDTNIFNGVSLYMDTNINHMKANKINFRIKLKDKNETIKTL
ncbi:MAG: LPS export ABC transporter periplasmic protein LptC [Campylobacterota bacterium]|nr:LPS export ABC transporter periplasmic protein LptC [Campylobacterota bacterium]